jgi:hypothetical protein
MTVAAIALAFALAVTPTPATQPAPAYDRAAAASFIAKHWNDPARIRLEVLGITFHQADDCAYFASEVLWAGGLEQSKTWSASSTDAAQLSSPRLANPGPTKTVMLADSLEKYLVATHHALVTAVDLHGTRVSGAQVGDLITYDWNDNGVIDHVSVVRSAGASTRIAQHNVNIKSQSWRWSSVHHELLTKLYAQPRAYLVHITG